VADSLHHSATQAGAAAQVQEKLMLGNVAFTAVQQLEATRRQLVLDLCISSCVAARFGVVVVQVGSGMCVGGG